VIEHNLDVIKTADYLIDLGPEGGDKGGTIVATGTPEEVARHAESFTGAYLREVLNDERAHGRIAVDAAAVAAREDENLRSLTDLIAGGRVPTEAA
jgi:excinuclease ABC subunit A